jgi:hypothetical protein
MGMDRRSRGRWPDAMSGTPSGGPGGSGTPWHAPWHARGSSTGAELSVAVAAALLVVVALRLAGVTASPAEAVQPYAPRSIAATPVPSADWFALTVRASGFRPNSTVLVDVDGVGERSMVVDAAGVVDLRVELPDRVGVRVRGIALEGGGLDLRQEVTLVRPDSSVRDIGLVLVALLALALAVAGPRLRLALAGRRAVVEGPVAPSRTR